MFDVDAALHYLIEVEGSDLHLKVPSEPIVRVDGNLRPIEESDKLTPEDTDAVLQKIIPSEEKLAEFRDDHEVDFAYSIPGLARFRVNAFSQRGSVSLVLRAIPYSIRTVADLGLPGVIRDL